MYIYMYMYVLYIQTINILHFCTQVHIHVHHTSWHNNYYGDAIPPLLCYGILVITETRGPFPPLACLGVQYALCLRVQTITIIQSSPTN